MLLYYFATTYDLRINTHCLGVERDTAWIESSGLAFDETGRAVVAGRVVVAKVRLGLGELGLGLGRAVMAGRSQGTLHCMCMGNMYAHAHAHANAYAYAHAHIPVDPVCTLRVHVHSQAPCHHPGDVRILSAVDRPELQPNPNPDPDPNPNLNSP